MTKKKETAQKDVVQDVPHPPPPAAETIKEEQTGNDATPPTTTTTTSPKTHRRGFLDYLGVELREMFEQKPPPPMQCLSTTSTDGIRNFFRVPLRLEMFIFYSMIVVIDIFLHTVICLPLRAVRGIILVAIDVILHIMTGFARPIASNNLYDVVIGVVLVSSSWILYRAHAEEQEETYLNTNSLIALAAITGIMETFDSLFSTFGADALDSLHSMFWISFGTNNSSFSLGKSWNELKDRKKMYQSQVEFTQQLRNRSRFLLSFMILLICTILHSLVLFMHLVCLMKAIERKSLLTILFLNNMAELSKGVSKKYTTESLFSLAVSETVERFKIILFVVCMAALGVRNHNGNALDGSLWGYLSPFFLSFQVLFGNCCLMMAWEMLTDNVKHCFLCKESGLSADVYSTFITQMQNEVNTKQFPSTDTQASSSSNHNVKLKTVVVDLANHSVDHSYSINHTVGLPKLPMACVFITSLLIAANQPVYVASLQKLSMTNRISCAIAFVGTLLVLKISVGILVNYWSDKKFIDKTSKTD